jgi:hypothetical protein
LAPAPANAGAWIAPEKGQEIWTNVAGERDELYFFESSAYLEAPLGERTSFIAAPWYEQNYDTQDGWRAEAVVGLKRAIFRSEDTVMALQVGALWLSHPNAECSEGGAELRWLGGHSFDNGAFLNLEAATRALSGGCAGERLDLTGGTRFGDHWLALGQVFLDAPQDGEDTVKAQVSLVRFGENGRGIQLGLRARVDGGAPEPALVLGFWGPAADDD